jgi:hypothetical protein
MSEPLYGTLSATGIGTLTTVATIDCQERKTLWLSFTVGVALTAFTVEFAVSHIGDFFTMASVAGDYTTPEGPVLGASGDLTTAAISTTHWLKLDVEVVKKVRIKASSTSGTLTGHYQLAD